MTDKKYDGTVREFDELLKEVRSISTQDELTKLEKEVFARLQTRYMRSTSERCSDWNKLREWIGDGWEDFFKPFKDKADEISNQAKDKRESLGKALQELADSIELQSSDKDNSIIYIIDDSAYSTQGYGAITYAKGMAEIRADECKYLGIDARVETKRYKDTELVSFEVHVPLNAIEVEILKFKLNNVPFKETLRSCLKRCLNPRVYWSMLPWGYEEKLGLGMRGEDLTIQH